MLVGTALGRLLLEAGRWKRLRTIPFSNPETATVVANDILADKLIMRLCKSGSTFVDVGAHIGSVLTSVHYHDPSVQIVAIEADPKKAEALRKRFPYCKVLDVAVGERESTAEFYLNSKSTGYNSLVLQETGTTATISVRVATLDALLPEIEVDVLKMDIEGAELGALRGGKNMVEQNRPTIMFESVGNKVNALGYSATLLWEWFTAMDYLIFTPDRLMHMAAPLNQDAFIDAHWYPFRSHNYFAVHKDRRDEIRDKAGTIL